MLHAEDRSGNSGYPRANGARRYAHARVQAVSGLVSIKLVIG